MRYVKTDDYDSFVCLAGACPDTCCAGWEIVIDEHSLEAYGQRSQKGDAFAKRLARSVDWEESVFRQTNRRCAFLEDNDLCALYTAMGPEALCDTCRNYPRHMEEFEGLREYSLSLSCPEAARIILTGEKPQSFLTEEDDTEDEIFDDMDLLLFSQLEDARAAMFEILQDQTLKMQNKKDLIVHMAADIQRQIDENEYFKIDETIQNYKKKENSFKIAKTARQDKMTEFMQKKEELKELNHLERLRPEWQELLDAAEEMLFASGWEAYDRETEDFETALETADWERMEERLVLSLLYTYFCGAVYDGFIYAKAALTVFSARWIRELVRVVWKQNGGSISREDIIGITYRYAREIEHSDENLGELMEYLDGRGSDSLCG